MVVSQLFATSLPSLFETPITADKRFRITSPKLPSATSFIRNPLYISASAFKNERTK